ncbi:MAG: hypothetical protein ACRCYS_19715, partial [Beijerinckiaceae bacterium]
AIAREKNPNGPEAEDKSKSYQRKVQRWLRDNPDFQLQYARARKEQAESDADSVSDIAQKVLKGLVDPNAARVAIDALKWSAGKRDSTKFGDKLGLDHSGSIQSLPDDRLNARLAELLGKAGAIGIAGGSGEAEGEA